MTGILKLSVILTIAFLGVICFPPVYKYINKHKMTSKGHIDIRQIPNSVGVPFGPYDKELFEGVRLEKRQESEKPKSNILTTIKTNPFLLAMIIAAPLAVIVLITSCVTYCVQRSKLKTTLEEETRRTAEEKARVRALKGKTEGKGMKGQSIPKNTTTSVVKTNEDKSSEPKHGAIEKAYQTSKISVPKVEDKAETSVSATKPEQKHDLVSEADSLIIKMPLEATIGEESQKDEESEKKNQAADQVTPLGSKEEAEHADIPTETRVVTATDDEKQISFQLTEDDQLEPVVPVYREDTISVIITRDQERPLDSKREDEVTLEPPEMFVVGYKMDISSTADLAPETSSSGLISSGSTSDRLDLEPPGNMQHTLPEKNEYRTHEKRDTILTSGLWLQLQKRMRLPTLKREPKNAENEEPKVLTNTNEHSVFRSHSSVSLDDKKARSGSVPRPEPKKLLENVEGLSGPELARIMITRSRGETSFNVPPSGTIIIRDEQSSRKDTEDEGFTVVHKKGCIEIRPSNPLSVTIVIHSYPGPADITPTKRRSSI